MTNRKTFINLEQELIIFLVMDNLGKPNDKFFKEAFTKKETARSFIREYLPVPLQQQCDLKSLEILKDSFIDKELSEHFSDLLYRIKISGKSAYLYLLFEHKSYLDTWVGFQLLRNMVKIWELYRKQHKQTSKLPVILPLVIYHGQEKWKIENSIVPLFEDIENTRHYIPDFRSEVYDISHIPDEQIKGEILLRVHLMILKYINKPQFMEKLHDILVLINSLSQKTRKTEVLETFLRYLSTTLDSSEIENVSKELEATLSSGGVNMPTMAEKWLQEGMEKGRAEGLEKGKLETAAMLLKMGMSVEKIREATGLDIEKIEALCK